MECWKTGTKEEWNIGMLANGIVGFNPLFH
jgi:hypothetical protein